MSGEEEARKINYYKFSKHPPLKPGGGFFVNRSGDGGE
jgi:hypothetical protein